MQIRVDCTPPSPMYIFRQHAILMNAMNENTDLYQALEKNLQQLFNEMFVQSTNQWRN